MFQVRDYENGEVQCDCASFSIAIRIARALAYDLTGMRFVVLKGDEIKFDTRDGYVAS